MMRTALPAALLLSMLPLLGQEPVPDAGQLTREGVALYDAGKLDEAIAKYRAALAADPHYAIASYELGLTLAAKGDYPGCRDTLQPFASGKAVQALVLLGNCTDSAGDRKKATEIYRTALAIAPDDPRIAYELGLVLLNDGKYAEARELLKKDVTARPNHVNGRHALAVAFDSDNFRVPAVLEYLHFLAFDPTSPSGNRAAQRVRALLDLGVEHKGGTINLTVDPNERTEEGDYKSLGVGLALASGVRFTEEKEKKSEFEQVQGQVVMVVSMFLEMPQVQNDYTARAHRPFFDAMKRADLLDAYAATALSSLHLEGSKEWAAKNQAALDKYAGWIDAQREGKPAVTMPSSGK